MAKIIDSLKEQLMGNILTETEIDVIMENYGFTPLETVEEAEGIIKYTNYRSQLWVECVIDDGEILVTNIKFVTKEEGETKVDPFHSFKDLKSIQDVFWENKKYHHWLIGYLQASLGRRIGDVTKLNWSDLIDKNGNYRDRLKTLKEEKTGKIIGVKFNQFARDCVDTYRDVMNLTCIDLKGKVFNVGSSSFRAALKKAVKSVGLTYPVSCHSYRKYYANTQFQLHPQDKNALLIIQMEMGHSSELTTRDYINEIDRQIDKYNDDFSKYLCDKRDGKEYVIDDSPIATIKKSDLRELLLMAYREGNKADKEVLDAINLILKEAEKRIIN